MKPILMLYLCLSFIGMSTLVHAEENPHSYVPQKGFVPDAKTAERIAIAVWTPIYGEEKIEKQKPFHVNLKNNVWTVEGSLPKEYTLGGVALAEISKTDGRILRVSHGK